MSGKKNVAQVARKEASLLSIRMDRMKTLRHPKRLVTANRNYVLNVSFMFQEKGKFRENVLKMILE